MLVYMWDCIIRMFGKFRINGKYVCVAFFRELL